MHDSSRARRARAHEELTRRRRSASRPEIARGYQVINRTAGGGPAGPAHPYTTHRSAPAQHLLLALDAVCGLLAPGLPVHPLEPRSAREDPRNCGVGGIVGLDLRRRERAVPDADVVDDALERRADPEHAAARGDRAAHAARAREHTVDVD